MIDWLSSMQQTFEFYVVDPGTWRNTKRLNSVVSCTISRDADAETLGSATIDVTEDIGECYIRVYLVVTQNGVTERFPLDTFLVQTPATTFSGMAKTVTLDAYTPLLELKENPPPLGYSILKDANIMTNAHIIARDNARAPIVPAACTEMLFKDFVANTNDTWLTFLIDLIANAKYNLALDEMGRILFSPEQDAASLQPVWTYDDSNSSILYPEISIDRDLYGIPNVVEVVYSSDGYNETARAVNDDPNSPISTVNRGREIIHRVTNPEHINNPVITNDVNPLQEYADKLLRELSTLEVTLTYSHGYCPVRLGDCVRLNYKRAGLTGVKAKVISQTIKCKSGCQVTEKAVFNNKLWR